MEYYEALNRDAQARREFSRLASEYRVRAVVETGTYHGLTTEFLASLADQVHSVEVNREYLEIARKHLGDNPRVRLYEGNSPAVLRMILPGLPRPLLVFLDAHWGDNWPLLDELRALADCGVANPVVAIHDFLVPGTDLGYDTYRGQPLNLGYVAPLLPALYPSGYRTSYNDERAGGSRRGILYVTPAPISLADESVCVH